MNMTNSWTGWTAPFISSCIHPFVHPLASIPIRVATAEADPQCFDLALMLDVPPHFRNLQIGLEQWYPETEDLVRRPGFEPGSLAWTPRDGSHLNPKFSRLDHRVLLFHPLLTCIIIIINWPQILWQNYLFLFQETNSLFGNLIHSYPQRSAFTNNYLYPYGIYPNRAHLSGSHVLYYVPPVGYHAPYYIPCQNEAQGLQSAEKPGMYAA